MAGARRPSEDRGGTEPHGGGHDGGNMVFLVGSPRSGTTWLQSLLASNPKVRSGVESYLFSWYLAPQVKRWRKEMKALAERDEKLGLKSYFTEDEFVSLLLNYLKPMVAGLGEGEIFLEKTPDHAFCMKEINYLLPKAKFIHIVRDGREVVSSLLGVSKTWGPNWAPSSPRRAAKLWADHVRAVRRDSGLIPKGQFFEVRYEELRNSPLETLRTISEGFLGLEWSDDEIKRAIADNSLTAGREARAKLLISGETAERLHVSHATNPEIAPASKEKGLTFYQGWLVWLTARDTLKELGYL